MNDIGYFFFSFRFQNIISILNVIIVVYCMEARLMISLHGGQTDDLAARRPD